MSKSGARQFIVRLIPRCNAASWAFVVEGQRLFDSGSGRDNIKLDGSGRMYPAPYRSGLGSDSGA
jgi:hypothetical protein